MTVAKYGYEGPERFRPLSPWAYVGYTILFLIPVIGWAFFLYFTFNKTNINRRSYVRSYWAAALLALLLLLALIASCVFYLATASNLSLNKTAAALTALCGYDDPALTRELLDMLKSARDAVVPLFSNERQAKKELGKRGDEDEDFTAMVDGYEAFFDEYIAFMENYDEDSDDPFAMLHYFDMLFQYNDTMKALDEIDEEALNDADQIYLLKAQLRISRKLLDAAE